jgi:hypothetical protein
MARAPRSSIIDHMPDPDVAAVDLEPEEEQRFDVHEWFEDYLAREHDDIVGDLVGVPLS